MNPLIQSKSGTTPVMSRNAFSTNQGTNEDDPQSDPHPEAGIFGNQTMQNSGQKIAVTWWRELQNRLVIVVTWRQEVTRKSHTAPRVHLQESRKRTVLLVNCIFAARKRGRPATIEGDQILLALQQLANNNNSANFHENINRISKLPKSLTTTMPTIDGKSEKFELFEDLFQTSFKKHNELIEHDRINYFHSLMRGHALQTFNKINGPTRENLGEILAVFRRKHVKPQSMVTAKYKFQRLVFNPANQKLVDFLDELQKLAKDAFGIAAHAIIDQFIYAKMPPRLKESINQAHLENGTYEQIVTHLERELELKSSDHPDETQMNTVTHKQQIEGNPKNTGIINSDTNDSSPNNHKIGRKSRTLYPPCETCGKTNHSTERCYVGANAVNRPLPWNSKPQQQVAQDSITGCVPATTQHLK